MPPRRSTARAASATPISNASPAKQSAQGASVLPPESTVSRRTTRGASQQPVTAGVNVNNPRLPEVQIQQSYAYGSSKTPVLPTQLVARSRMNLREIADTLDAGVEQAQQHLQNHLEEAQANLQNDARSERAQRRSSREGSVASDDVEKNKTQRVAAWASSLDSSQLDEIPEEDSSVQGTPDNASRKDTDPSSFPSGIFDHSYNYERGLRRPNITIHKKEDAYVQRAWRNSKETGGRLRQIVSKGSTATLHWTIQLLQACGHTLRELPNSPLIALITSMIIGLFLASSAGLIFCYTYTNFTCDPLTASPVGLTLQKYCGACIRNSASNIDLTTADGEDLGKIINSLRKDMRSIEVRLDNKIDKGHVSVDKDFAALRKEQIQLSDQMSRLGTGMLSSSNDVASPVIAKINYFALNNGASIEPRFTSPTNEKPLHWSLRIPFSALLSTLYQTKSPTTALEAWQDVGDFWCAAAVPSDQDSLRLGVKVMHKIFPTELVVENYPHGGSLFDSSIPKNIELWADFQHLNSQQKNRLGIGHEDEEDRKDKGDTKNREGPFGPTYALIGQAEYDASREAPHVQSFRLDVNQGDLLYHAQYFVVRVVSNYGSDHTCLYRVRLHGVSAP